MIFKDILNNLKKDKKFTVLIVIQLCITFIFINLVINNLLNMKGNLKDITSKENSEINYRLVDQLYKDKEKEQIVFNDKKYLKNLKSFYDDLSKDNTMYTFYDNTDQQLYIKNFHGADKFYDEYKYTKNVHENGDVVINGERLSGINNKILNKNIMDKYKFNIVDGRLFNNKDFAINNVDSVIPVLVGYEFKDYYQVGDIFEADLYYKRLKFKVIGILEKDTYVNEVDSDDMQYLDTHIITPSINYSLDVKVKNEKDYTYINIFYLQKTNGAVGIKEGYDISDFINKLDKLRLQNDIFKYEINGIPTYNMNFIKLSSSESIKLISLTCLVMTIFSVISISAIFICRFIKNKYDYGVHLLLGATKLSIILQIVTEMIILCLVSNFISFILTLILSKFIINYSIINLFISIFIVLIGCIVPSIEIKNTEITSMIGDKN